MLTEVTCAPRSAAVLLFAWCPLLLVSVAPEDAARPLRRAYSPEPHLQTLISKVTWGARCGEFCFRFSGLSSPLTPVQIHPIPKFPRVDGILFSDEFLGLKISESRNSMDAGEIRTFFGTHLSPGFDASVCATDAD